MPYYEAVGCPSSGFWFPAELGALGTKNGRNQRAKSIRFEAGRDGG